MILHLDFETRSTLDLREVGLYNYARHPSTDVWCAGWVVLDAAEPTIWTPDCPGAPLDVARHVLMGGQVVAHNAPFELAIWNNICVPRYGWPELKPEQTFCTMSQAYAMSLPGALGDAAHAMGLHVEKDAEGHALMLRMARPRRIAPDGTPVWWTDADKLARLYEYCRQDVRVERELYKRLMPLSAKERKVWLLDYAINQRGVAIDVPSVAAGIALAEKVKAAYDARMNEITGGQVANCNALIPLKTWLAEKGHPEFQSGLAKADVAIALDRNDLEPVVREVITLRSEAAKASAAKLDKMLSLAGSDGRLHNMFQYHGAGTGRWAGRGVQPHNLPRDIPPPAVVERVLELVRAGDADAIDCIYGSPVTMLSRCIRSLFVAPAGKVLNGGDWSSIEGRGVAWLAGEEWKLRAFREADAGTGPGIYELAYAHMFHVPVETVANPSFERQVGKTCLAEGTRVVTDRGPVAIERVTLDDQLWDGHEWVKHDGLLDNGMRSTVVVDGVSLTPDHLVATKQTWTPARVLATSASIRCRALATGSANLPWSGSTLAPLVDHLHWWTCSARAVRRNIKSTTTTCAKGFRRAAASARLALRGTTGSNFGNTPMWFRMTTTGAGCSIESLRVSTAATIQKTPGIPTTEAAASLSTPPGAPTAASFLSILYRLTDGMSRRWNSIASTLIADTNRVTCGLCRVLLTRGTGEKCESCKPESASLRRVYDLANAGPRGRFTIRTDSGFLLVHNCELAFGYQGGVGAFQTMSRTLGVQVDDIKADQFKVAWRAAHPKVKNLWYDLQRAAIAAVNSPGQKFTAGPKQIAFKKVGSFLWCLLPSGRALCYPYPKLMPGDFGEQLTYMAVLSQADRKGQIIPDPLNTSTWARVATYGGAELENVTQAICRDILAEALLRLDEHGFSPVLHVHDEPVSEDDTDRADEMTRLLSVVPDWATGFPIAVKCHAMTRYGAK